MPRGNLDALSSRPALVIDFGSAVAFGDVFGLGVAFGLGDVFGVGDAPGLVSVFGSGSAECAGVLASPVPASDRSSAKRSE